jgi:hypothetical protein
MDRYGCRTKSFAKCCFSYKNLSSAKVEPIIIEQNGLGEELFRDGQILQIEVDAGDHKWVSVDGGGVYYLSADGHRRLNILPKKILHFQQIQLRTLRLIKKQEKYILFLMTEL